MSLCTFTSTAPGRARRTVVAAMAATSLFLGYASRVLAAPAAAPPSSSARGAVAQPSNEPPIKIAGPAGTYLTEMHRRIHPRWIETFVKTVAATYPAKHPFNDLTRKTTVAVSVRWDGTVAEARIETTSGSVSFDGVAIDIIRKSAPYPFSNPDVVSDDGYVHVSWTFARDERACAAGPKLVRAEDPLDLALPRLISQRRVGEALRRLGEAVKSGREDAMDQFARLYLRQPSGDASLDILGVAALASAGDRSQLPKLREALASTTTSPIAARTLAQLGADVCAAVEDSLKRGEPAPREAALAAVGAIGAARGDVSRCQTGLAATLGDRKQPRPLRLSALSHLATYLPTSGRPAILAAANDSDVPVRAAAILASARKGGGRPELYRLAPLLHHHAVEIRAAASAGVVRAAGDGGLDQLYRLWHEPDPRLAEAVARELAVMSTAASAEFLGRLAERPSASVRIAAVRALAARHDATAAALLKPILDSAATDARAPAELKALASRRGANDGTARAAAAEGSGSSRYKEMLSAGREREAASWLVTRFEQLPPQEAVDLLGTWLARSRTGEASKARPGNPGRSADLSTVAM